MWCAGEYYEPMKIFERTLLIANPTAQSGAGAAAAFRAADILRTALPAQSVELILTQHKGHARELVSECGNKYSCIVALGGDGIVHEVANGMMQPGCKCRTLGVLPVGSGNDYAKTLGMNEKDLDKAVIQLLGGKTVSADLGCCNGEYFTETLSFGLDAAIALGTEQRRLKSGKKGTRLYLEEGIDQLFHHLDFHEFSLEIAAGKDAGDSIRAGRAILVAVQVGPTYGGGFRICPEASIQDGQLDICVAHGPVSIPAATGIFLLAKNAMHTRFKRIEFLQGSQMHLSFAQRPPCQIDGEEFIADAYYISVAPQAIDVLVGKMPQ